MVTKAYENNFIENEKNIDDCIEKLNSKNFENQLEAIKTLETIQDRKIYPILIELVQDTILAEHSILSLASSNICCVLFSVIFI